MKKIKYFVTQLSLTVICVMRVLLNFSLASKIRRNDNDKAECVVLGNGPSLLKNLDFLIENTEKFDFIAVNFFGLSDAFFQLRPKYYVIADPAFFEDSYSDELKNKVVELFKIFRECVDWKMDVFIPNGLKTNNLNSLGTSINVLEYNKVILEGFDFVNHFLFKVKLGMPRLQNVLIGAISLSIWKGYQKIYLFGADHSWTKEIRVNELNQVCLVDTHFYGKTALKPWYKKSNIYKMAEILVTLSYMFSSYEFLGCYAKSNGIKIFNCTNDSFIDAFERIDYSKMLLSDN